MDADCAVGGSNASTVISFKEHPLNAEKPMLLILSERDISVRLVQLLKACWPIFSTDSGIAIEFKALQP